MTTTIPKPNVARLIRLAEWAGAQDARRRLGLTSEWDQDNWVMKLDDDETEIGACGTACCIAGKVVLEDGWVPLVAVRHPDDWTGGATDDFVVRVDKNGNTVGKVELIRDVAIESLGLTDSQASRLFDGSNDLDDVLHVIATILAESTEG